jgi:cyclopropane fatty-acyl-phospholipid synthase-like methyltransferase
VDLKFIKSDVFTFRPSDSNFDLILCLGLVAHVGRLDTLLAHLKSMLTPSGRIILQTTLMDHAGTRIVRALTTRRELAQRGYRISWFSRRNIIEACRRSELAVLDMRRHSLGIPFGDRFSCWANLQLEKRFQKWASRHGADAIYLLEQN